MEEDRESYIEELSTGYKRSELNEIALGLGLNVKEFKNKRSIAEAILASRERVERTKGENIEEEPIDEEMNKFTEEEVMGEVMEEMEKVSPDSVKGKLKAIEDMTAEFNNFTFELLIRGREELQQGIDSIHQSVRSFEQSIENLAKDYDNYMKKDFQQGIAEFNQSVRSFQESIANLTKEFENYVKGEFQKGIMVFQKSIENMAKEYDDYAKKDFKQLIVAFHQRVKDFEHSIQVHANENQNFIKRFYG